MNLKSKMYSFQVIKKNKLNSEKGIKDFFQWEKTPSWKRAFSFFFYVHVFIDLKLGEGGGGHELK